MLGLGILILQRCLLRGPVDKLSRPGGAVLQLRLELRLELRLQLRGKVWLPPRGEGLGLPWGLALLIGALTLIGIPP